MGGFGFLFMLVVPVLVIGGLVWLVLALVRVSQGASLIPSVREAPLDTLKARYAKGEISKEQFEQMKHDLA